jgi:hypothetical protein
LLVDERFLLVGFGAMKFLCIFWNIKPTNVQAAASIQWSKKNKPALTPVVVESRTVQQMEGMACIFNCAAKNTVIKIKIGRI